MYRRKRYYKSDSGEDLVQALAVFVFLSGIVLYYYFKTNPGVLLKFGIYIGGLIVVSLVAYFILRKIFRDKWSKTIQQLEDLELKDPVISNFINRNGKEKGSDVWKHNDLSFKNFQIQELKGFLKERKGIILSDDDIRDVLEYFIDKKNRDYVYNAISSHPEHHFSELNKDGKDFEKLVARLSDKMGYVSKVIGAHGDQGGDVIANKDGESVLIQAKFYEGSVGNAAVQQAAAAMQHYGCNKSIVITTSYFTTEARELAKSNSVRLIDGSELKQLLLDNLGESWS